jgi:uncharacterized membrane protein
MLVQRRLMVYLLFAVLATATVILHTAHFEGRAYRQDEAWIVHGALYHHSASEVTQWVSVNIHPPLWVGLANLWVQAFGQDEAIARTLSSLLTLGTLALLYRLGADLSSDEVGLWAVFLVGSNPFFQFYGHEFRPYAALALCTVGLQWSFMRWLRRPDFKRALWFVGFGIAALYVHFFAFYVLAALALFFVLFVRWNRARYLRALGLFVAIGLSYLGWLLPFLHAVLVTNAGGIDYALETSWELVGRLYSRMDFRPHEIGALLFLTSLLLSVGVWARHGGQPVSDDPGFRRRRDWRKWYALLIPSAILVIALLVNTQVPNLTQRSLVILLPGAALFLGYGLSALPKAAKLALVFVIIPVTFSFIDFEITGPQAEVAQYMSQTYEAGSPVIMNVNSVSRQIALNYYIQERMSVRVPIELMWQVFEPKQPWLDFLPASPAHAMYDTSGAALEALRAFLDGADQVWYVERDQGSRFSLPIINVLQAEGYTVVNEHTWEREYRAVEYRRASD